MQNSENINDLLLRYDNAALRSLIQLIPYGIGSAIDVLIVNRINNIRRERTRVFFDELAYQTKIKPKDLEDNEFLHAFFATMRFALNTHRSEKIILFAKLFSNFSAGNGFNAVDEYEEMLSILDDLSFREIQVMQILYRFEKDISIKEREIYISKASDYWNEFWAAISLEIGIPKEEISGFLERLKRTGLYNTFDGYVGGELGHLTPNFYKFIKLLNIE